MTWRMCLAKLRELAVAAMLDGIDAVELRDVLVFGGIGMVGYGIAAIFPPAAWIFCGAAIFWLGVRR